MSRPEAMALVAESSPIVRLARRQRRFLEEYLFRMPPGPGWTTPNRVTRADHSFVLREFIPEGTVGRPERSLQPVLIVPPEVNHSSIVDFRPGQSLVEAFCEAGFERVATIEWLSATRATRGRDIDDSIAAIHACLSSLGGAVHLVGVCQGGWESAIAVALRPELAASLTLVAAPIDFWAGEGLVKQLARLLPMPAYEALVLLSGGLLRGRVISFGFDTLMPVERFVLRPLSVWNHLDDEEWMERFRALDDWYRYPKDLAGPLYLRAVKELFKENRLVRGEMTCLDQRVDLSRVTCPVCLVAGARDHITPAIQVWAAAAALGSRDVLRVQTDGGHVGAFMGRRELRERWPRVFDWLAELDRAAQDGRAAGRGYPEA